MGGGEDGRERNCGMHSRWDGRADRRPLSGGEETIKRDCVLKGVSGKGGAHETKKDTNRHAKQSVQWCGCAAERAWTYKKCRATRGVVEKGNK